MMTPLRSPRSVVRGEVFEWQDGVQLLKLDDDDDDNQDEHDEKLERIYHCLMQKPVPLWQLRELALSRGGLVNAQVRQIAWPLLVGIPAASTMSTKDNEEEAPPSSISDKDVEIIRLDAGRSVLGRYRTFDGTTTQSTWNIGSASESLANVLESTLARHPRMQYYQGLHDIAAVLLFNLKEEHIASLVLSRLCRSHLRDFLRHDNFQSLISFLQSTLLPLLHVLDPQLHGLLVQHEEEEQCADMLPTIMLPWIITWCIHDVSDPAAASRLMDALICGHSSMIVYMTVAIMIQHRDEFFEMSEECFPEMLFMNLKCLSSRIVSDYNHQGGSGVVSVQTLVDKALDFMHRVPPRSLAKLASRHDKTTEPISSFFFKAPTSWALASFPDYETMELRKNHDSSELRPSSDRAKLASGVTHLIQSVQRETKQMDEHQAPQGPWGAACRIMFRNMYHLRAS